IACDMLKTKAYPRYLLSIAHRLMAEIVRDSGKPEAATLYFNKALEYAREAEHLQPDNPRGYAAESECWESRPDLDKAIEARNRSLPQLKSKNDRTEFFEYRWRLLYWTGRNAEALDDLRKLTEITPTSAPRWAWFSTYFQAMLLADSGNADRAVDM